MLYYIIFRIYAYTISYHIMLYATPANKLSCAYCESRAKDKEGEMEYKYRQLYSLTRTKYQERHVSVASGVCETLLENTI